MLRILASLLRPHAGEIEVFGEPLPRRAFAVRAKVGLLAHEPLLYRELTARENLDYHARLHRVAAGRVDEVLDAVEFQRAPTSRCGRSPAGWCSGSRSAARCCTSPELLLLDEPRANLDPAASELVEPLIGRPSGATRVLTSHDPRAALAEADLVLALKDGRTAYAGEPAGSPTRGCGSCTREDRLGGAAQGPALELRTLETVPAMVLLALVTFVIFHFGLNRATIDGQVAAGVLTVTLLFAAMLGINRLFVAEREQGGFDAFLLAPVDRSAMLVAKAAGLFIFLAVLEVIAVPAFGLFLLGPSLGPALPGGDPGAGAGRPRVRGDRHARVRDRRPDPGAGPDRADDRAAAADPGADRHRARARAADGHGPRLRHRQGSGWPSSRSMIWCSLCSPTRCSTFSWRNSAKTTYGKGLRGLSIATVVSITAALALVFFYAPLDANQGFIQKIFYIHVPLAIVSLCGFVFGAVLASCTCAPGDRKWDMRSYVAIHMALIFGVAGLISGSIWAKASWGHWWVWHEPTLVSYLIVVLLFATYQPLRFSIEDPERQSLLRERVRDRRGRLRAAELPRRAAGDRVRASAGA